eukprot:s319_g11.t1
MAAGSPVCTGRCCTASKRSAERGCATCPTCKRCAWFGNQFDGEDRDQIHRPFLVVARDVGADWMLGGLGCSGCQPFGDVELPILGFEYDESRPWLRCEPCLEVGGRATPQGYLRLAGLPLVPSIAVPAVFLGPCLVFVWASVSVCLSVVLPCAFGLSVLNSSILDFRSLGLLHVHGSPGTLNEQSAHIR